MTQIMIDRALVEQVLETIEGLTRDRLFTAEWARVHGATIAALRTALAQQEGGGRLPPPLQAEPVAWRCACGANLYIDADGAPRSKEQHMTDREPLELAAKAAGYWVCEPLRYGEFRVCLPEQHHLSFAWNPLTDDGDALRLAVKLRQMHIDINIESTAAYRNDVHGIPRQFAGEPHNGDPLAATRRAIVRAAAEIGRQMT